MKKITSNFIIKGYKENKEFYILKNFNENYDLYILNSSYEMFVQNEDTKYKTEVAMLKDFDLLLCLIESDINIYRMNMYRLTFDNEQIIVNDYIKKESKGNLTIFVSYTFNNPISYMTKLIYEIGCYIDLKVFDRRDNSNILFTVPDNYDFPFEDMLSFSCDNNGNLQFHIDNNSGLSNFFSFDYSIRSYRFSSWDEHKQDISEENFKNIITSYVNNSYGNSLQLLITENYFMDVNYEML